MHLLIFLTVLCSPVCSTALSSKREAQLDSMHAHYQSQGGKGLWDCVCVMLEAVLRLHSEASKATVTAVHLHWLVGI